MAIERSELHLVWPPALFAAEAQALLAADADDDALAGLLAEAFHGGRGQQMLLQVAQAHPYYSGEPQGDPWGTDNGYSWPKADPFETRASARLVADLARDAENLPKHRLRPLFGQRQRQGVPAVLGAEQAKDRFAHVIRQLCALGYFQDAFGSECDDAREDDPARQGQRMLAERLQVDRALWPLHRWDSGEVVLSGVHKDWPDEVFFEVIEALDEVVARPRQRYWHSFHDDWDYADFTRAPGQAVYRWRVNEVLDASTAALRLATSGSDAGLLVHTTGDARDDLVEQVLKTPEPGDRDQAAYAVSQFRARDAGRQAKRGAVITLVGIFEARRQLLKDELLSKDEGALFEIANKFAIRHQRADQRPDYDEAYLDWIFWWYLATIELSDRLIAREAASPGDRVR